MVNVIRSGRNAGRIIAIGDVHGCSAELEALLGELKPTANDQIIFLGDLINRGPDSVGALRIFNSLKDARCVIGNHELRLLDYRRNGDPRILKDYDWATIAAMKRSDWDILERMEPLIHDPRLNVLFVHGGFLPDRPWRDQGLDVITSIQVVDGKGRARRRGEAPGGTPWADLWKGPEFVVYGHTPRNDVYRSERAIGIDTSCAFGVKMTAYILPEGKLVQVLAFSSYMAKAN